MIRTRDRSPHLVALAALLTALALPTVVAAQNTFSLISQNMLHLGWGQQAYQNNKYNYFQNTVFNNFDVALLQEVMRQTNGPSITPGTHTWYVSGLKGRGNYKEAYGFLVKTVANGGFNVGTNSVYDYPAPNKRFIRPPAGILVLSNPNPIWLVSYHAIYGKRKAQRVAEVSKINNVYNSFLNTPVNGTTYNRIVIAGDWNLRANDAAFNNLRAAIGVNARIEPAGKTSLKRNGGLSQPYDHFAYNATLLQNVQVIDPPMGVVTRAHFRRNYSDHLGIRADVNY